MTASGRPWSGPLAALGVLVAVFLLGTQAVHFAPGGSAVAVWWPAAGLSVALVALAPHRWWPALGTGVLVFTTAANLSGGRDLDVSVLFGSANAAEALVAGYLLRARRPGAPGLESLDDFVRLAVSSIAGAACAATGIALTVAGYGTGDLTDTWRTVLASHSAASIVIVPAALALGVPGARRSAARNGELLLQALALLGITLLVFAPGQALPLVATPLPLLVWAALRFDLRVVTAELLAVSVLGVVLTAQGHGPFGVAVASGASSDVLGAAMIQLWLVSASLMSLPLTVAVEQRRQLLDEVTAREQLFRRNFTESLIGMLLLGRRGDRLEIVDANEAAERLLGDGATPLVGRYLDRVLDEPDAIRKRTQDMLLGALDGWNAQMGVSDREGSRINIAVSLLSSGPNPMFSAQLLDISAEHSARVRIEAAEKLTNATLDTTACIIIVTDLTGRVVRVNSATTELTGFTEDELLGRPVWERLTPAWRIPLVQELFSAPDGSAIPSSREADVLQKDGGILRIVWNNSLVRDEAGVPRHVVFTGIDVTAERHAAGLVNHLLEAAIATALVGIDVRGRITIFNSGAQRLLGYAAEEVIGTSFLDLLDPDELAARTARSTQPNTFDALTAGIGPHGETQPRDWTWLGKDGTRHTVSMTLSLSGDAYLAQRGFLCVGRDVTEQRHSQEMLIKALETERTAVERLRRLDVAKDEFVSTVSHELRTPVTSIIGYTELLKDGSIVEPVPAQLAYLDKITRNGERLTAICNDLLLLSGLDTGGLVAQHTEVDLVEVARQVRDGLEPILVGRDLRVELELPTEPVVVVGDRDQLERVLVNLAGNAVKFTEDGGDIRIRLVRDEHRGHAVLMVRDTGLGIPADEQGEVFRKFFRSSTAQDLAIPGTGLGLSIAHGIVTAHGGHLDLESAHQEGTTLTVQLPLLAIDQEARTRPGSVSA